MMNKKTCKWKKTKFKYSNSKFNLVEYAFGGSIC